MLPALLSFNGEPFVDDDGRLLYKFPDLQVRWGHVRGVGVLFEWVGQSFVTVASESQFGWNTESPHCGVCVSRPGTWLSR